MDIQFRTRIPYFEAMGPRGEKQIKVTAVLIVVAILLAMLSPNLAFAGNHNDNDSDSHQQLNCNADPEAKLKPFLAEFGLTELWQPTLPPNITFVQAVQTGNLLYLSGNGPQLPPGGSINSGLMVSPNGFIIGKLPTDLNIEQAKQPARLAALNQLAVIKKQVGSLKHVKRIVKLFGMVNTGDPTFTGFSGIINGASDLLVAVFGDCGYHARSAVGLASLPFNVPVEIEMIVELKDKQDR